MKSRNFFSHPARGGSTNITEKCSPRSVNERSLEQINLAFSIPLSLAFFWALITASLLISNPVRLHPLFFAAIIPTVHIPQYASSILSCELSAASSIAVLYNFSVCIGLI